MKTKRLFIFVTVCLCVLSACSKNDPAGPANDLSRLSETGDLISHSYGGIEIRSFINVAPELRAMCKFGVQYSKYEDMSSSTKVQAKEVSSDNSYETYIGQWPIGTPIYYRSYIEYVHTGIYEYGDVKKYVWDSVNVCESGAVDLGLSVKWGACFLGASSPFDTPDKFAFGETESKSSFTTSNYSFDRDYYISKYSSQLAASSSGKIKCKLDLEDDAAHRILGGKWRMPTVEEWQEFGEYCGDSTMSMDDLEIYMTTYPKKYLSTYSGINYKGVIGYLKTDGKNGIFIPEKNYHIHSSSSFTSNYDIWRSATMYITKEGGAYKIGSFLIKSYTCNSGCIDEDYNYQGGYILPVMDY